LNEREEREIIRRSRRHEAAERAALRRWLRQRGQCPELGDTPSHTERLMKAVIALGGDAGLIMAKARIEVDERDAEAWR